MQQVIVDCATGEVATVALTVPERTAYDAQQAAAATLAQQQAREAAFQQQQGTALAGVSAALHGAGARDDAAALAGLVHKLVAEPPQPLSAPEVSTLARFVLRCLLPAGA